MKAVECMAGQSMECALEMMLDIAARQIATEEKAT